MLDEELIGEITRTLPDVPYVFISSVAHKNPDQLKDMIWHELNN